MRWLSRLVSGPDVDALSASGEAHLAAGRPGEAKLAFERALDRAARDGADEARRAALAERVDAARDALALARLHEAESLLDSDAVELARQALDDAAETAVSEATVAAVEAARDRLERGDAKARASEEAPPTDEERLAVLAASWDEPQADEYAAHGEPLDRALLALLDGRADEARAGLEALLAAAGDAAVYLHLEHARACALAGDQAATRAALAAFLARVPGEGSADTRLLAHLELARLVGRDEGFDAAVAELERAIEAHPGDYRPLHALGAQLRAEGHAGEAVEVLEAGAELLDDVRPDWRYLQELGLARRDAGQRDAAIEVLEGVLRTFTAQRARTLPADTLEALAGLYEDAGRLERAADLWRTLADGGERGALVRYHLEASRLVAALGLTDEARRLLRRAAGLAEGDAAAEASVAERLAALDAAGG